MEVIPGGLKFAVTASAPAIVTVQVGVVPEHAPPQLTKLPAVTFAVSVTVLPCAKGVLHVPGQLIPAGVLVTVPLPPAMVTLNVSGGPLVKVAVTDWLPFIATVQAPFPLQAPPQPLNTDPLLAVAVNVTLVPLLNPALHVLPQEIPAGLLLTVPAPLPASVTVS